jgi:paraquat-inducible protein B
LLTGAVYVAIDFFPGAAPATVDWSQTPPEVPTIPGQLQVMETKVTDIIDKLDKMPFQEIGGDLHTVLGNLDLTLTSARGTLVSARGTLTNAGNLTESNSPQLQQLGSTLQEVSRAARALRVLADYLERHPEALLRGKKGEAK